MVDDEAGGLLDGAEVFDGWMWVNVEICFSSDGDVTTTDWLNMVGDCCCDEENS